MNLIKLSAEMKRSMLWGVFNALCAYIFYVLHFVFIFIWDFDIGMIIIWIIYGGVFFLLNKSIWEKEDYSKNTLLIFLTYFICILPIILRIFGLPIMNGISNFFYLERVTCGAGIDSERVAYIASFSIHTISVVGSAIVVRCN